MTQRLKRHPCQALGCPEEVPVSYSMCREH
jgi:hypothetical protein